MSQKIAKLSDEESKNVNGGSIVGSIVGSYDLLTKDGKRIFAEDLSYEDVKRAENEIPDTKCKLHRRLTLYRVLDNDDKKLIADNLSRKEDAIKIDNDYHMSKALEMIKNK